ncbi:MAG TPA: hypothetical protein VFR32_04200 [Gaiellaceae bacterium]|nr:hypothetical protein [Gaiellaceae bacterium]
MSVRRSTAQLAAAAVVALAAFAPGPAAGQAVAGCDGQAMEQPFLRWLDPAQYVLAPDGGLEAGASGWTLAGGARVVAGNEPWHVGGATHSRSLALPAGSSATTGWMCVSLLHPTLRLFAANGGSLLSPLKIEVLVRADGGSVLAAPIATTVAGSAWQPTLPMPILGNATNLPLVTDGTLQVAFRFTPIGLGGSWQIDDTYVDPYQGR